MELFLGEWNAKGHVHENYNAITGSGDDVSSSDRFYHWAALLALMDYMEASDQPAKASLIRKLRGSSGKN